MFNFPIINGGDLGGLANFKFCSISEIDKDAKEFDGQIIQMPILSIPELYTGLFLKETGIFGEKANSGNSGTIHKQSFNGFYPGINNEIVKLFSNMIYDRFFLVIKDPNKNTRIIGTKDNGAKFSFNYSSGKKYNSEPGYEFEFEAQSRCTAPYSLSETC